MLMVSASIASFMHVPSSVRRQARAAPARPHPASPRPPFRCRRANGPGARARARRETGTMTCIAAADRYDGRHYRRCGRSGLMLPEVSLGLWQNFGEENPLDTQRAVLRRAFDLGVTHFDLANNYGPPYGSAEENFGKHLRDDFRPYRDELIISSKAGYDMWPGPSGEWGSRKSVLASLAQSLRRA